MKLVPRIAFWIVVCLIGTLTVPAFARNETEKAANSAQVGYSSIVVNGRVLTGPNSSAQTSGRRILIPAASLARALGDRLAFDPASRSITVNRENGSVVLVLSSESILAASAEQLMLPVEIASTLFDVSIRFDRRKNLVIVVRGKIAAAAAVTKKGRSKAEIYQAQYEYNLSRYSNSASHDLILTAAGRVGDGRFDLRSNSSGTSPGRIDLRNATVNVERPNGQRFVAGDFGSSAALPLMASNIRGGMAVIPVGSFNVAAFGGRTDSGAVALPADPFTLQPAVRRSRYDSAVYGAYVTKPLGSELNLSAGAMRYRRPDRAGEIASTSVNYAGSRLQFQADLGVGRFQVNNTAKSSDVAIDLAGTYRISDNLGVQGRYAHVGARFLTAQSGVREPVDLKAVGVTYSPLRWLTTSVNATTARRPGVNGRAESFVTAAAGITPGSGRTRLYLSHSMSNSSAFRSGAFTLLSASRELQRWRLYMSATRTKTIGRASADAQFGANVSINDANSLDISQGFGSRRSMNGFVNWRTSNAVGRYVTLTAGLGYNYSRSAKFDALQRLTAGIRLPRESSLQVSYTHSKSGPTLFVQLRGTLFRRNESSAFLNAPLSEVNNLSRISGRVYQDTDGDGKYDAATDKAQPSVKVRIDGSRYVETDANGIFSFDAVTAGSHKVYLDLISVRADLTLVDGAARELELSGGRTMDLDFRLVRTGRIAGRVFFDKNGNGSLDDGESPLADIRIATASGRDTLTDADGHFSIADLAPGEHTIFIDEKTLPEKIVSGFKPVAVQVFPGKLTGDITLAVISQPAEVKHFGKHN